MNEGPAVSAMDFQNSVVVVKTEEWPSVSDCLDEMNQDRENGPSPRDCHHTIEWIKVEVGEEHTLQWITTEVGEEQSAMDHKGLNDRVKNKGEEDLSLGYTCGSKKWVKIELEETPTAKDCSDAPHLFKDAGGEEPSMVAHQGFLNQVKSDEGVEIPVTDPQVHATLIKHEVTEEPFACSPQESVEGRSPECITAKVPYMHKLEGTADARRQAQDNSNQETAVQRRIRQNRERQRRWRARQSEETIQRLRQQAAFPIMETEDVQYVMSQKGKRQLVYKGYLHRLERTTSSKLLWKCADYHQHKCTARVHTVEGKVVRFVEHVHVPDVTAVHAKKTVQALKEKVTVSHAKRSAVLAEHCSNVSSTSVSGHLLSVPLIVLKQTEDVQYVMSQKGKRQLLYKGYLHRLERTTSSKLLWKCADYHQHKCTARVHTVEGKVVRFVEHVHVPDVAAVHAKKIVQALKEKVTVSHDKTSAVLAEHCSNVSTSVSGHLPSVPLLVRRLNYHKAKNAVSAPFPKNCTEFHIPSELTVTIKGESFLFYDSGVNSKKRILIFVTPSSLDLMSSHCEWLVDGTFKVAPHGFKQLFSLHVVLFGHVLPMLYALLPDKLLATCLQLFTILLERIPTLNPTRIVLDFESSLILAVQKAFPSAQIRGCFFHFTQCLWRKLQSFGLADAYSSDPDFSHNVRKLTALAFVPTEDIPSVYNNLMQTPFFVAHKGKLNQFLNYFESTWIGLMSHRGQRTVGKFPLLYWNCFGSVFDGSARTNNQVQGWHQRFSSLINVSHPNLCTFLVKLRQEQDFNDVALQQIVSGASLSTSRKKYRDLNKISFLVQNYSKMTADDYLSGLAFNFNLQK